MPSKHDQIAEELILDVLTGSYRPGERLPSERDLAARFEANRGAVREAMKKLEQIGLAEISPGGARAKAKSEASLDVIGYLLRQGAFPDQSLVHQILSVIQQFAALAAEEAVTKADDDKIENISVALNRLHAETLTQEEHNLARLELMQLMMQVSGNLPLQIIARSLFEQFAPNMSALADFFEVDHRSFALHAAQLEDAIKKRDIPTVRSTFQKLAEMTQMSIENAYDKAACSALSEANNAMGNI